MSLRSTILRHSIPHLPATSFTRQTLLTALSHLPSGHPDHRADLPISVVDTLFGTSEISAGKALVDEWESQGRESMGEGVKYVGEVLAKRLDWSARLNEHLVEAYALLSTPETPLSIPFPHLPTSIRSLLSSALPKLPPLYTPNQNLSNSQPTFADLFAAFSNRLDKTDKIPLLSVNPIGAFRYAWKIADEALVISQKGEAMRTGVMNEPVGPGPEWYTSRAGLSLAYLAAESHLLQPYPSHTSPASPNPHLQAALASLQKSLERNKDISKSVEDVERGTGDLMGWAEFTGKSLRSLIQSRGF